MQKINIFVKAKEYINLTDTANGSFLMNNPPMYNTQIYLYKGIDNKLQFSVRDNDRKAFCIRDKKLTLTFINHITNTKMEYPLWCVDAYKGLFELTIPEKDLRDIKPTYYKASVVYKDLEGEETILYSSINYDPTFDIYVKEGFREVIKPSFELNPKEFLQCYYIEKRDGQRYEYFASSKIKADETTSHTASVTVKDHFLGKIVMEASTELEPLDNDWFEVDSKEYTLDNMVPEETFMFNKELSCLWVRFKYVVKSANLKGYVSEILYRN